MPWQHCLRPGYLSLACATIAVLQWSRGFSSWHSWHFGPDDSLMWGAALCLVGLVGHCWLWLVVPTSCENHTVSRHCQVPSPWGQNHPLFLITGLCDLFDECPCPPPLDGSFRECRNTTLHSSLHQGIKHSLWLLICTFYLLGMICIWVSKYQEVYGIWIKSQWNLFFKTILKIFILKKISRRVITVVIWG